jgi:hypothetical protein
MRKIGILAATLAAGLCQLAVTSAPAAAETRIVHDARGDVPAFMDVVKLRATNGAHRIRIALHVRNLQPDHGRFELGVTWSHGSDYGYSHFVRIRATRSGAVVDHRSSTLGGDVEPAWTCGENRGTLVYRPARDRIIFSAPQRCLRTYDHIRVVNNWSFYAVSHRWVDGELQFDSTRTARLRRG